MCGRFSQSLAAEEYISHFERNYPRLEVVSDLPLLPRKLTDLLSLRTDGAITIKNECGQGECFVFLLFLIGAKLIVFPLGQRYNVSPRSNAAVIRREEGQNVLKVMVSYQPF